jgi:vacuolar-type H+-ATPase subunit I/STV1
MAKKSLKKMLRLASQWQEHERRLQMLLKNPMLGDQIRQSLTTLISDFKAMQQENHLLRQREEEAENWEDLEYEATELAMCCQWFVDLSADTSNLTAQALREVRERAQYLLDNFRDNGRKVLHAKKPKT